MSVSRMEMRKGKGLKKILKEMEARNKKTPMRIPTKKILTLKTWRTWMKRMKMWINKRI